MENLTNQVVGLCLIVGVIHIAIGVFSIAAIFTAGDWIGDILLCLIWAIAAFSASVIPFGFAAIIKILTEKE